MIKLWTLPQVLLGLLLKPFVKIVTKYNYKGIKVYVVSNMNASISLGNVIYLSRDDEKLLNHEYGHIRQSLMLGWLYLIVIGLPSFIWCNLFRKYRIKNNINYYSFWTEKWADKLGGVER